METRFIILKVMEERIDNLKLTDSEIDLEKIKLKKIFTNIIMNVRIRLIKENSFKKTHYREQRPQPVAFWPPYKWSRDRSLYTRTCVYIDML